MNQPEGLIDMGHVVIPTLDSVGFCEGVVAADKMLEDVSNVAREFGIDTVYGYHDVVHNATVSKKHEENGVIFVNDHRNIPMGSIAVLSAHGSAPQVQYDIATNRSLAIDAACPLVLHTHREAVMARRKDEQVLYVAGANPLQSAKVHDEVLGMIGHLDSYLLKVDGKIVGIDYDKVPRAYLELTDDVAPDSDVIKNLLSADRRYRIVTQTTLDSSKCFGFRELVKEAILQHQPDAAIAWSKRGDVCDAVHDRQKAVRLLLTKKPEVFVVVTDTHSKNGMGYVALAKEIVAEEGTAATTEIVAVETAADLHNVAHPMQDKRIAVTASASTPDSDLVGVLKAVGADMSKWPTEQRPKFNLHGSKIEEIRLAIHSWLHAA